MNKKQTKILIEKMGGPYQLARLLNEKLDGSITPQAICQWKKVPVERALQIEKASKGKFCASELRPDIFNQ